MGWVYELMFKKASKFKSNRIKTVPKKYVPEKMPRKCAPRNVFMTYEKDNVSSTFLGVIDKFMVDSHGYCKNEIQ